MFDPDDLDDEDAFMAKLSAKMSAQKERGIEVGADNISENTHTGLKIVRKPFIEPKPQAIEYEKPPLTKHLVVGDLETDPFSKGRRPEPFCAGLSFEEEEGEEDYIAFWGDDCVAQMFEYLVARAERTGTEYVVYFHNGGNFDFNYFMEYMDDGSKPFYIGKRMVKVMFCGIEFRDSYSLMPIALKKLINKSGSHKLDIEYWKMERMFRDEHRDEILEYLRFDCITLLDALRDFISRFGWRLTIAGTATPYIAHFHGFDCMDALTDKELRPYFAGGRVQCFEQGIILGKFVMVDANSMYPAAMSNFLHPVSVIPKRYKDIRDDTDFATIEAEYNHGALGAGNGNEFDFTRRSGVFLASIHEINAGLETGTLRIKKVIQSYSFTHKVSFREFVDEFYTLRAQAKANEDVSGTEFYKLVMNSGYGRFAMNSSKYKDHLVNPPEPPIPQYGKVVEKDENGKVIRSPTGWRIARQDSHITLWQRPARGAGERFVNVATAASITGAARSVLWRAICASTRPIYCDTDSIICEHFNGDRDEKRLGAWKVEAEGDAVCIAGKKMYAFMTREKPVPFNTDKHEEIVIGGTSFWLLKKAHKGVQMTGQQIVRVCGGEVIEYESEAPTFNRDGSLTFSKRRVQMTGSGSATMDLFRDPDELID